ncbi:MAG: hypothetical protein A2V86_02730 [Deltaproteobacteria bacterium RBG_16_49_23]|nr:MAG: hypothetical protein A2V86_02730 [Deltaproteobacteria bacterium RBG_16_49_23]
MEKFLRCKDLGLDCNFEACGDTAEEVLRMAADHAQAVHGLKSVPGKGRKRAWEAIQDAFCIPKGGYPPDEGIFYPVRNNAPLLPPGQRPSLRGGAWAGGCSGVTFYNNSGGV